MPALAEILRAGMMCEKKLKMRVVCLLLAAPTSRLLCEKIATAYVANIQELNCHV